MLATVLTFLVFFIPRLVSIVSKYLSPSKGNIGNMLTRATPRSISDIQYKVLKNWKGNVTGRNEARGA